MKIHFVLAFLVFANLDTWTQIVLITLLIFNHRTSKTFYPRNINGDWRHSYSVQCSVFFLSNLACQIKCLAHLGVWSGLGAVNREELPWLCRLNWQLPEAWLTTTPSSSCRPNQTETNTVFQGWRFLGAIFNFLLGIIWSWTFTFSLLHLILLLMTMSMELLVFGHEHSAIPTEIFGSKENRSTNWWRETIVIKLKFKNLNNSNKTIFCYF